MSDLKSRVTGILVSTFGLEPAALAGSPTLESLEFDSLALVEFATALEAEFSTPSTRRRSPSSTPSTMC